jgi:hypothetical protein
VCKCVLYYCHRVSTQFQLTNISISIIEDLLEEDGKGKTNTIIMGDWNSAVADKSCRNIVGPQGLGGRNQSGQMLVEFCGKNKPVIINILIKKPKRRLYIWKTTGSRSRQQWDYTNVKHLFRNSMKDVQTDTDSDYTLLVGNICTKLKKIMKFQKGTKMGSAEVTFSIESAKFSTRKIL